MISSRHKRRLNMKIRLYLFFAFVLSLVSVHAQIYTYTNDSAGNYSAVASNATGQKLTRHNGAVRPVTPCTLGFSSDSFTSNATYASTLPCVEADVAAVSGYQLSVTGFSVGLRRSNTVQYPVPIMQAAVRLLHSHGSQPLQSPPPIH